MNWLDIAATTIACVLAVHMGLMDAVQKFIKPQIPMLGCVRCLTFWCVLLVIFFQGGLSPVAVAISFLAAWLSIWLELLCGLIDKLYEKIFHKIYKQENSEENNEGANPTDTESSEDTLRELH